MAFNNSAPLSYASGEVVKYVDAARGLADDVGGPALTVVGLYNPKTNDLQDPSFSANTSSHSRITANTTSQQLLAANTSRKGLFITNEAAGNNTIYVKFGGAANATSYSFPIYTGGAYEAIGSIWVGNVHVITTSSTCNVVVAELA